MRSGVASVLLTLLTAISAGGYYEDVDTPTSHSTFHYELTRVLARAAGFTVAQAELLAVADEAVDLGTFAGDTPTSPEVALTGTDRMQEVTAKIFHWPRRAASGPSGLAYPGGRDTCSAFSASSEPCTRPDGEVGELESWAFMGDALSGFPPPTASVDGAPPDIVTPGSLTALAVYLHTLADSYSHELCMLESGQRIHCVAIKPSCPTSCTTELWHTQAEYGDNGAGVDYTQEAGRAVWQALKRYRELWEIPGTPLWNDDEAGAFIDAFVAIELGSNRRTMANDTYVTVATCSLTCSVQLHSVGNGGLTVALVASIVAQGCTQPTACTWHVGAEDSEGDCTVTHTLPAPGRYPWEVVAATEGTSCTASGELTVPLRRIRRKLPNAS